MDVTKQRGRKGQGNRGEELMTEKKQGGRKESNEDMYKRERWRGKMREGRIEETNEMKGGGEAVKSDKERRERQKEIIQ